MRSHVQTVVGQFVPSTNPYCHPNSRASSPPLRERLNPFLARFPSCRSCCTGLSPAWPRHRRFVLRAAVRIPGALTLQALSSAWQAGILSQPSNDGRTSPSSSLSLCHAAASTRLELRFVGAGPWRLNSNLCRCRNEKVPRQLYESGQIRDGRRRSGGQKRIG